VLPECSGCQYLTVCQKNFKLANDSVYRSTHFSSEKIRPRLLLSKMSSRHRLVFIVDLSLMFLGDTDMVDPLVLAN
jgi:hypothetical protein